MICRSKGYAGSFVAGEKHQIEAVHFPQTAYQITKDKYNTKKMNPPKVIFTPGVDFKNNLDEITFELVAE